MTTYPLKVAGSNTPSIQLAHPHSHLHPHNSDYTTLRSVPYTYDSKLCTQYQKQVIKYCLLTLNTAYTSVDATITPLFFMVIEQSIPTSTKHH